MGHGSLSLVQWADSRRVVVLARISLGARGGQVLVGIIAWHGVRWLPQSGDGCSRTTRVLAIGYRR